MGDPSVYFGDDFGQKIDLTVRIREILRNYPEGTSIFKEMVQNADDAGATEVVFCLDLRQHSTQGLAYEKMAKFQGPSLLVYNNAQFTDADFKSIQRIGDSMKKDHSKGWKTGRFGVGFNSVYHLTDLPAFVSGSHLVFFDPQACHLPNVNPSNPGKSIDFINYPSLINDFPDQVTPFRVFGCNFDMPFEGTIFRLALRSAEQAMVSRLSNRAQTPEHMLEMLAEFAETLHLILLFLRNVTVIRLQKWEQGEPAPTVLCEAAISNVSDDLRAKRSLSMVGSNSSERRHFDVNGRACDYEIDVEITKPNCDKMSFRYSIANQLGGGECSKIANDPANAGQRLVPWGGVAARLPSAEQSTAAEQGLAFCFLPLPTHTYLPVHVNGYFELSSNRRDIWFGEGLSGDGLVRAQWNKALLQHVIAPCYARMLMHLTNAALLPPVLHPTLLPTDNPPEPWDFLAQAFFNLIRACPCLHSNVSGGLWVSPAEALIVKRTTDGYESLVKHLLDDDVPVVSTLNEGTENLLVISQAVSGYVLPSTLRAQYRRRHSRHSGNREAIRRLLGFMFRDLDETNITELDGVNLLPLCNDSLSTFRRHFGSENSASLEYLGSMGFARAHALRALRETGNRDVESALNWLLSHPNPSSGAEEDTSPDDITYFIPTNEERILLSRAQDHLVDVNAIPTEAMELLSSIAIRKSVNVKPIDLEDFEDLLARVFPTTWYGKFSVPWKSDEDAYSSFDEEWFRLLWRYLGPSNGVRNLQDKWPLLPADSGVLYLLSSASGVVSAELLPPGCVCALNKLNVPVLLKNLFATIQPHPDIWNYVHQPTPAGVLSCLIKLCEATELDVKLSFKNVKCQERRDLRAFLLSDSCNDLNSTTKRVLCSLPLFEGLIPKELLVDADLTWTELSDSDATLTGYSPVFVPLYSTAKNTLRSICPGVKWSFIDENFVHVQAYDQATIDALDRLSVSKVSKAKFFSESLFPRLDKMPIAFRIDFTLHLLRELNALLAEDEDGSLTRLVETAPIFPTLSGELKRIIDLYDPDIDEFSTMMDESFFPALELQEPQPLSVLRSLGLQRHLTRRSVLALACSIDAEQVKIIQANLTEDMLAESLAALRLRSTEFFKYVDSHIDQLVSVNTPERRPRKKNIKTKSFKLWRTLVGESGTEKGERQRSSSEQQELERIAIEQREVDDFIAKMDVISWAPVSNQLDASLPRHCEDAAVIVACPQHMRLPRDQKLCSSEYHILGVPIHSDSLRQLFTWNKPVGIADVAKQLKAVAVKTAAQGKMDGVWSTVYEIYKTLSRFFESGPTSEERERVLSLLSGNFDLVWVGGQFVAPHRVALTAVVNAEPYLFGVSSEMVHFRPFLKAIGVRDRFNMGDYVNALVQMHSNAKDSSDGLKQRSLSSDELISAIGLVQLISDSLSHHADHELFAPDMNGVLSRSIDLCFDDAPWLDKRDTDVGTLRFIHPKISNEVAAKIGAKSLRSLLLTANQEDSLFASSGDIEAFGQSEALTKRISHILEQYPDGPHIISELIQNADDAGATKVCLMYSDATYGSSSLLGPGMAKWQGPALYCYNDAEFQDSDFISLARIGQGGKLQKVSTTGRFGLGFNSVYHFTDLPSIVSASSIVMFDPHATHLPVTPANPGIRVRFVSSSLPNQFPDQFEPLKLFGCDLKSHFHGTLFRFPLRHEGLAAASEIKQRAYRKEEIFDLLSSFRSIVADAMIFLRNVRSVSVMVQPSKDTSPVLLYSSEVPGGERGDSWRYIDRFISGLSDQDQSTRETSPSSKAAFYSRLARTAAADLPSVTQILHITTTEREDTSLLLKSGLGSDTTASWALLGSDVSWNTRCDEYLVCNQIGGGSAREMACATENASLKLIPWVGVAGRIQGDPIEGRGFCFLPLPVRTGLPVHINGYFELSSNRRDIWHGDDLSGDGKLRSDWNSSLLRDAAAPAYVNFLLEAKRLCGRNALSCYMSLFPTTLPPGPWGELVRAVYALVKEKPVFSISPSALSSPDSPISPAASVLVDEGIEEWEVLESALNSVSIYTVRVPAQLRQIMTDLDAVLGTFSPKFFRSMINSGRFLPSLDVIKATAVIRLSISDAREPSARAELNNLPLIPVLDGSYKTILILDSRSEDPPDYVNSLFFVNELESELLSDFKDRLIGYQWKTVFEEVLETSNLFEMKPKYLSSWFLPRILPDDWRQSSRDLHLWEPGVQRHHPTRGWVVSWWKYVQYVLEEVANEADARYVEDAHRCWPLIPVVVSREGAQSVLIRGGETSLMALVLHPDSSVPADLLDVLPAALGKLGVAIVDYKLVGGRQTVAWMLDSKLSHQLSLDGFLSALGKRLSRPTGSATIEMMFSRLEASEVDTIEKFVTMDEAENVLDGNLPLLRQLPIFRVFRVDNESVDTKERYRSIDSGTILPGDNADSRVLGPKFFVAPAESMTRKFLRAFQVEEWSYTQILLQHVFPTLENLRRGGSMDELVISVVQNSLLELPFHQRQDPRFRDALKELPIILSQKGTLRLISDMYDPNNRDLAELVGPNSLPDTSFATSEFVAILRSLGLRDSLSCHSIVESARSIEAMIGDDASLDNAWTKAISLLKVVNRSFDDMAAELSDSAQAHRDSTSVEEIVDSLRKIKWLPVHSAPLKPLMPWRHNDDTKKFGSAESTRPESEAWRCSCTYNILFGHLQSDTLAEGFGWREPIDATVLAHQLAAVGNTISSSTTDSALSADVKAAISETQRIYQSLDDVCRGGDAEVIDSLCKVLESSSWIWTGKSFVRMQQVAADSDVELEPLLFTAPPDILVPRSLLVTLGLKEHFEPMDYVLALRSLFELSDVVSPSNRDTCLKLFERISSFSDGETSILSSSNMFLLDDNNRLVHARDLVYDDMEWNESSEVRQGCRFVSRDVPRSVALALGAKSLHSKLAETSVSSTRLLCPSAGSLTQILPSRDRWFEVFFTEMLHAAETLGGSQVDIYVDYRKHASQRVIQPSFQELQQEAICVHIHDLVLSTHDVNNLFGGEMSRPGLLTGFTFSDCLQILSGDGFYVLDPTTVYLGASTPHNSSPAAGLARRYDILGEDFLRYPDQILPFCTLPSCPSNVGSGTQSTLLRFPWRKSRSGLSDYTLSDRAADSFVRYIRSQLVDCLVFTESVHRVSLWSVGKGSEFAVHAHGEAALESPQSTLRKRKSNRQNNEWRKKFSFQSFFKSPVAPENQIEFVIKLDIENKRCNDTWIFCDIIGAGRSRDLANSPVHEVLNSIPYVSVAARLFRDGDPALPIRGKLYNVIKTTQDVGVPVHINGCFKKQLNGGLVYFNSANSGINDHQAIMAHWNRVLLEDGVVEVYSKLLLHAKRRYENSIPKAFYRVWPTSIQRTNFVAALLQSQLYRKLETQDFFLCTDGHFRSLNRGYVVDVTDMDLHVVSYAQMNFPSFDIPSDVMDDARRLLPSRVVSLTPRTMRRFLRNVRVADIDPTMCLSLLEYCLGDVKFPLPVETDAVWGEFQGLPLLPLENGTVGLLGVNQRGRYVLASFNQIRLLTPLAHTFVSLEARQRLQPYFSDARFIAQMGLSSFSIKTLADNIHVVLPSGWKDRTAVEWNPSCDRDNISQEWLYRFWCEVRFERRSLAYFSAWPLIPVQGSRLLSCGKPDAAVCVWKGAVDHDLRVHIESLAKEASTENDKRLADREAERKRMRELAALKGTKDDARDSHSWCFDDLDDLVCSGDPTVDDDESRCTDAVAAMAEDHSGQSEDAIENNVDTDDPESSLTELVAETHEDATIALGDATDDAGFVPAIESGASVAEVPGEEVEYCTRETLHLLLSRLNVSLIELAYLSGQESDIIPSTRGTAITVLDGISSSEQAMLKWTEFGSEDASQLAEFFSHHSQNYGGYNRMHVNMLKRLPIYVNVCGVPCALDEGEHFLVPSEIDLTAVPLPPNARQRFMLPNPRLTAFYKDLGVEVMSYGKLLTFLLPFYGQLSPDQQHSILNLMRDQWPSLRGDASVISALRSTPLFASNDGSLKCADAFFDPRNKVFKAVYSDEEGSFPAEPMRSSETWLDLMAEIGLRSEITVGLFIECAKRLEALFSSKVSLTIQDEIRVNALHEYFVQNFDKYDRSRVFFEEIASISFVPAIRYDNALSGRGGSKSLLSRTVLVRYSDCATPDDQALVFSVMPVLATSALPPRVLWSRLGLQSPPPKEAVLNHLFAVVENANDSVSEAWIFFTPVIDAFQSTFNYLQEHWDRLTVEERLKLTNKPVVPVGSSLVKGNRLFFHLAENLAPLMFEVPRAFGAYDSLFRHLGSKDTPEVEDYILFLRDLANECGDDTLNLNELVSVTRIANLLANGLSEQNQTLSDEALQQLYLPSASSTLCRAVHMAYNDAPWVCARVDLTELQVVHPRVSPTVCDILGVKGISQVVEEELETGELRAQHSRAVEQMNAVISSHQFGNGLRTILSVQHQKATTNGIIDFDELQRRILSLSSYQVRGVDTLHSRFVAKLGHPPRSVDVTKTSAANGSISFVKTSEKVIYIALKTLTSHTGIRAEQIVASAINQLLGGAIQDCSAVESMLNCDVLTIPSLLQLLNIQEDPTLITEKLRGTVGEVLCESDINLVELAPLRTFFLGETVAIEVDGGLRYGRIMKEELSETGVNRYEVRIRPADSRWFPSTQIYSFKSSRGKLQTQSNDGDRNEAFVRRLIAQSGVGIVAPPSQSTPSELPPSVAIRDGGGTSIPGGISPVTVVAAVNDLLGKLNLSLDSTFDELIAENLRLQRRLDQAEEGRRIATAQVEDALREKKDALESLTCAICLESKVDRVLIPCGHIYCGVCVAQLPRQTCPICRQAIQATSQFHVPT